MGPMASSMTSPTNLAKIHNNNLW